MERRKTQDVLVRDVDVAVVSKLKRRAERNGRSLQAELKLVLTKAASLKRGE